METSRYAGNVAGQVTPTPLTIDSELMNIIERVNRTIDRARSLADRLGGTRPEAVSGGKDVPPPGNQLAKLRMVQDGLSIVEEHLTRIESYVG